MSKTVEKPVIEPDSGSLDSKRWMVVIFNNPFNTIDEVIDILITATGCSSHEAQLETWEAHHFGKAPCHFASKEECEAVAIIISGIGVKTEVQLEWAE